MTAPDDGGGAGAATAPTLVSQSNLALRPEPTVARVVPAPPPERAGAPSHRAEPKSRLGPGEAQPRQDSPEIADTQYDTGVLDPSDPLPSARKLLRSGYFREGVPTLHQRGEANNTECRQILLNQAILQFRIAIIGRPLVSE